jgi:hypothetical protein
MQARKKRKTAEETPHYERATDGPFTGVPGGAKRAAGVMRDGEHAKPGSWVEDLTSNLPKEKKLRKK